MSALGIIIFCLAGAMMAALVHAHGLMRQACAKTQRRKDAETRRERELEEAARAVREAALREKMARDNVKFLVKHPPGGAPLETFARIFRN